MECIDTQDSIKHAIKIIPKKNTSKFLFEEEVFILQKVSGIDGFPKFIDWGNTFFDGEPSFFIVQEMLSESLWESTKHEFLSLENTIKMGLSVLSNLEKFHDLGYVHGDIKPNNIMVNQLQFYLIDFGRAFKYQNSNDELVPN